MLLPAGQPQLAGGTLDVAVALLLWLRSQGLWPEELQQGIREKRISVRAVCDPDFTFSDASDYDFPAPPGFTALYASDYDLPAPPQQHRSSSRTWQQPLTTSGS